MNNKYELALENILSGSGRCSEDYELVRRACYYEGEKEKDTIMTVVGYIASLGDETLRNGTDYVITLIKQHFGL